MTDQSENRKFANTLARGLSVLRAFRASDDGLSHSEIAQRTRLAGATVTRLTFTLAELGFLSQDGKSGHFRLGPAAIAVGSVASASANFIDLAAGPMQDLADRTGTLALMAVRDGDRMMLAKTWRPVGTASIWLEPGHRIPIHGSSSGQAVVASLNDARFSALEPDEDLRAFRQNGYEQLVGRGFTIAPERTRYAATVNAVSVPYYAGEFGEPVAFTCGALPEMLSDARMRDEVGPDLRQVVRDLELKTGRSTALARRG
ncbi:IclR family transcriptional regulator [Aestuariivita sp.]|jgi:DNA-binding IclR family transcriptional regulator|uniref:IclR family transcriptional regulator n=1 Tax=Aestuariivita sp. TaxID=1872407 RepID=UPI0021706BDB|nr:IclR family transcriptional regulator [Aestuariivita sp.]MCE8009780.1 IclR family transcriptional regulator [Aestuariivita sp.]